jgi:hypothetical protein
MRSRLLGRVLAGSFLSFTALAVAPARAAVVWSASFEKGDVSEWMPGINALGPDKARKNVEVLGEQVYRGKFAGKITVHPDDKFSADQVRVDIQHQSTLTDEGKELWLSGHYYLPKDAGGREEFGFFESNTSFANVMDFWFDAKAGGGTTINFGTGFLGEKKLWTADFTTAAWHQVAIHVLWSTDPQKGTVDVWFDGVQVVTAAKGKTKADGNTLFYQTGLHRRNIYNVTTTDTVYIDDFIEADNLADAKIAAPTADPTGAGGASGVAGAAGAGGGSAAGATSAGSATGGTGGTGGSAGAPSGSGGTSGSASTPSAGSSNAAAGAGVISAPPDSADSSGCSYAPRTGASNLLSVLGVLGFAVLTRSRRRSPR